MSEIWKTYLEKRGWRVALTTGKAGTGDWSAFNRPFEEIYAAAQRWKSQLVGVERPWLCWNINNRWCELQQRLVLAAGWTPIVGWDPNCVSGRRTILPGAVGVDFNEIFRFQAMWPHFPLDFAFLWADRLAFWHADLLVRLDKLLALARMFETLKQGEMAAVPSLGGFRQIMKRKRHRYWELIGCTTREASAHQFENGCSWWRNFYQHPNTPRSEQRVRATYYYDSGVGIMYWKRRYGRRVVDIPERLVEEGHCTRIGNGRYITHDDKGIELDLNFDLHKVAARLGLEGFVPRAL